MCSRSVGFDHQAEIESIWAGEAIGWVTVLTPKELAIGWMNPARATATSLRFSIVLYAAYCEFWWTTPWAVMHECATGGRSWGDSGTFSPLDGAGRSGRGSGAGARDRVAQVSTRLWEWQLLLLIASIFSRVYPEAMGIPGRGPTTRRLPRPHRVQEGCARADPGSQPARHGHRPAGGPDICACPVAAGSTELP